MGAWIAKTSGDGVFVAANATLLTAALNISDLSASVQYDVIQAGKTAIIDQERLLVTARGTTLTFAARGAESTTPIAHESGARVRESLGATILSHTFDGATWLSQINIGGDIELMYAIEEAGVRGRARMTSEFVRLNDFPFVRYKPSAGVVMKVVAWTWVGGNVWAEFA